MELRDNTNKQREDRIRELIRKEMSHQERYEDTFPSDPYKADSNEDVPPLNSQASPWAAEERDPELLWRQGRGLWREDHALPPSSPPALSDPAHKSSFFRSLITRTVISALVLGGLWGIHKYQPDWSLPIQSFVSTSLNHEIDFLAVETWYESKFGGAPSFIPIFGDRSEPQQLVESIHGFTMPVQGKLAEGFAITLKGVEIIPDIDSSGAQEVKCVETGRVTEVSNDALTGTTVVVQHSGGYVSVYGRLSGVSVSKGDWLESGETVGTFSTSGSSSSDTLYFAMKKNGVYIDPTEVVPLD